MPVRTAGAGNFMKRPLCRADRLKRKRRSEILKIFAAVGLAFAAVTVIAAAGY